MEDKKLVSVRGATTVIHNNKDEILKATDAMLREIILKNDVNIDEIMAIFFTMTKDLDEVYPAVSARNLGITNASLMCYNELDIKNSLKKCIRVMVQFYSEKKQNEINHIYLNEARKLRPDLVKEEK